MATKKNTKAKAKTKKPTKSTTPKVVNKSIKDTHKDIQMSLSSLEHSEKQLKNTKDHKKQVKEKESQKIKSRFDKKKEYKRKKISKLFEQYIEHLSMDIHPKQLHRNIIRINIIIMALVSIVIIIGAISVGARIGSVIVLLLQVWTVIFAGIYILSIIGILIYFDLRIYNRTRQIEEVLPDFLQLASANISAGMPIDKALWLAVRPRFGILAKEIEEIARSTISGDDLPEGLLRFSKKYDSRLLRESVNLLVAGLESGGEIGELLDKIATNIIDTRIMKKEIAASVTTYVIFIGVASVLVAPFLFALSEQLLVIVQSIGSSLSGADTSSTSFALSFSGDSIKLRDYKIFAMVLIGITTYFSALIIGTIRKGNGREGLKSFPAFLVVGILCYLLLSWGLGALFGGFFF